MFAHPYENLRYPGFLKKALTFSYDDGVKSDLRLMDIFDRHGLKGTFNLNSGLYGRGSRLDEQTVRENYLGRAHEIAVHGYKHLTLSALPTPALCDEILSDRKGLEALTGHPVTGMAYAYGDYDARVMEMLRACGISYARTVTTTEKFLLPEDFLAWDPTCHHKNARLMELAKKFAEDERLAKSDHPWLFYVWGHSYEFDEAHDNNWHVIEEFAEYISGREDIWYATNGEICDYVGAFRALVFSVTCETVYNPTAADVYLHIRGKDVVARAGACTVLD